MVATEIASAYIALYTKMPGVQNDITKALGGSAVQGAVGKSGESMGSRLMDGMNKIGKAGAVAVGSTIAAGVGTALVKGFQRLDAIDQAEAKLAGLGHNTENISKIMENALNSVRGTAFGMGDAATVAASTVAAGVKPGKDLERTLKLVGDAATIAGTDMSTMGSIVNKVATSDMMQMDVANQLMDAGIPILQMVADQMGITANEAREMASDGLISFETFQSALESGLGGAALESGNTFSGAMDNVMAALGRVGANLLSGIFPDMKNGLGDLLVAMEPLENVAKNVGAAIGEFVGFIKENINWIGPLAAGIGIAVGAVILWTAAQWLLNAALTANPIGLIIVAIGLLIGAIILLVQNWDTVVAWLKEVWQGFVDWIVSVIDGFVAWWNGLWAAVGQFISDVWSNIVSAVTIYVMAVRAVITAIVTAIQATWNSIWSAISSFFSNVWNGIIRAVESIKGVFSSVFNTIRSVIIGAFNGVVGVVRGVINGIIDLVNGAIGGINGIVGAVGGALGFDVSVPTIPRLAEGGIVSRRPGGIPAVIGEGRYDEAVIPLSPAILSQLGGGREVKQENKIYMQERDPRVLMRQLGRELNGALS